MGNKNTVPNADWVKQKAIAYHDSFQLSGQSISAIVKGNLVSYTIGSEFTIPDRHAPVNCEIQHINKKYAIVKYSQQFDHRSFGVNKVTQEAGLIEIEYF